jgi:hypothetical protein
MIRVAAICAFAGVLLFLGTVNAKEAFAQRFPYQAPQAPEFDRRGNHLDSESQEKPRRASVRSTERPAAPSAPRTAPSSARTPRPFKPRNATPAVASRQSSPPPQPQAAPDCSQYPRMIASAQANNQMQYYARHYLTCLLKRGWRMSQAKQEVIRTIESLRRRGR